MSIYTIKEKSLTPSQRQATTLIFNPERLKKNVKTIITSILFIAIYIINIQLFFSNIR